jgi:hypothetical protein
VLFVRLGSTARLFWVQFGVQCLFATCSWEARAWTGRRRAGSSSMWALWRALRGVRQADARAGTPKRSRSASTRPAGCSTCPSTTTSSSSASATGSPPSRPAASARTLRPGEAARSAPAPPQRWRALRSPRGYGRLARRGRRLQLRDRARGRRSRLLPPASTGRKSDHLAAHARSHRRPRRRAVSTTSTSIRSASSASTTSSPNSVWSQWRVLRRRVTRQRHPSQKARRLTSLDA